MPIGLSAIESMKMINVDGNQICSPSAELATWLDSVGGKWRYKQACPLNEADSIAVDNLLRLSQVPLVTVKLVVTPNLDRVHRIFLHEKGATNLVIPPEVATLDKCEELVLSKNMLTAIPPEIALFPALKLLTLDDNVSLPELPAELGSLTTLETLNAKRIGLTTLPAELMNLKNLTTLNLDDNKLCTLSEEMKTWISSINSTWESKQNCQDIAVLRPVAAQQGFAFAPRAGANGIVFTYSLPSPCRVSLMIVNAEGRMVGRVLEGYRGMGNHAAVWAAANVPAGIYYVKFQAGPFKAVRKMVALD
jgi:hypothetical protein